MYVLCTNDHVYTCDANIMSISHKIENENITHEDHMYVSNNFKTFENEEDVEVVHFMINTIDDLLQILRDNHDKYEEISVAHLDDDLKELFYNLKKIGYQPMIHFGAGIINTITCIFNIQGKSITVRIKSQRPTKFTIEETVMTPDVETLNNLHKARHEFSRSILRGDYKSYYTDVDMEIFKEYRNKAKYGTFCSYRDKIPYNDLVEIDVTKAYTAAFEKIDQIPVFNEFDIWKPYNKEPIKDYNLYMVETHHTQPDAFFDKKFSLCFGKFLNKRRKFIKRICGVKTPSNIKKINCKKMVEELYQKEISTNKHLDARLKKNIVNICLGVLEKTTNKRSNSMVFDSLSEALYYKEQLGGRIQILNRWKRKDNGYVVCEELDGLPVKVKDEYEKLDQDVYILTQKNEAELSNGFCYIKELVYQIHNDHMADTYDILRENNIFAHSIKTDALTILKKDLPQAKKLLNFKHERGAWRVHADFALPTIQLEMVNNYSYFMEQIFKNYKKQSRIDIPNEWDSNYIAEEIVKHKNVLIRARYPGSGKTYSCQQIENLGYTVLFVCPTNVGAQKNNGITINKFFGVGLSENSKMERFNDKPYDCIVFDEIYMCDIQMLTRIKNYCQNNPDKIIVGTGDCNQLPPVNYCLNQVNYKEYYEECLNIIFPNEIYFNIPKRVKSQSDIDKLQDIEQLLLYTNTSISEIVKKYFKTTKQVITTENIALRNKISQYVSNEVRKQMNRKSDYEKGEFLICKERKKLKTGEVLNVNYKYKIVGNNGKFLTIEDVESKERFTLSFSDANTYMRYSYCRTCHSAQGATIKDKMTIFDWNHFHASREWVWTAITRAERLDDVYFYVSDINKDIEEFEKKVLDEYLDHKIQEHSYQDTKNDRDIDVDNYVNREWFKQYYSKSCPGCGDTFTFEVTDHLRGRGKGNLTCDRLDNSRSHELDNIQPLCITCNCNKSNR